VLVGLSEGNGSDSDDERVERVEVYAYQPSLGREELPLPGQ
jgi:hypothetical protein